MRIRILSAVIIVFAVAGHGAEPAWWTQKKRECNLPANLAYNTWVAQGMPCYGQDRDVAPDPFIQDATAYKSLVDRLPAAQLYDKWQKIYLGAEPRFASELTTRLDTIFSELNKTYSYRRNDLDKAYDDLRGYKNIASENEGLSRTLNDQLLKNASIEKKFNQFYKVADTLQTDTLDLQDTAVSWFICMTDRGSLPERVRIYQATKGSKRDLVSAGGLTLLSGDEYTPLSGRDAIAARYTDYKLQPLVGSNSQKLAALDHLVNRIEALQADTRNIARQIDTDAYHAEREKRHRLTFDCKAALERGKGLSRQVNEARQWIVVRAVENYVWKNILTHIAIPESEMFYQENKRWYQLGKAAHLNNDDVKRMVEEGKSALEIVSSRAAGWDRFIKVQERTMDLIFDAENVLKQAPEILALGSPGEIDSYRRHLEYVANENGFKIMEATGHLPDRSIPRMLGEVMNVPEPFIPIAKKLRLID